ncbi:MAG: hypothetical protein LH471_09215 [Salinibacterium sp.]|nr:hypothetical protein [Salinibacterium sp.]
MLGVVAGLVLTVSHQASVVVFGAALPWGVITAVVLTSALLAGLRLVFGTRIVPGFAAAGLLLAAGLLALPSPGGSILVPDSVAGFVWSVTPALISAIVLGFPNLAPRLAPSSASKIKDIPASKGSDLP